MNNLLDVKCNCTLTSSIMKYQEELKEAMCKKDITFQLVPPHSHRTNLAERATQTFKNHFKAGLASLGPDFPLTEWDRMIYQVVITLNLLMSARINPKLSAYAYIFRGFNSNNTPIAPPGTKLIAYDKPNKRASWAPNEEECWYIVPSLDHYICVNCYFLRTRVERNVDTVTFVPCAVPFPAVKTDDLLKQAALDIISILTNPPSSTTVTLKDGDEVKNALLKIAQSLHRIEQPPSLPVIPPPPSTPNTQVFQDNPSKIISNKLNTSKDDVQLPRF